MPSLEVDSHGVQAVATWGSFLTDLLTHAESVKTATTIEPALDKSDLGDLPKRVEELFPDQVESKSSRWASVETVARDLFSNLVATTPIESPNFVRVWNLFDILTVLSNTEECDPSLIFWLVEELLDSQTISGCRKVFDFLESRRERLIATHFKHKQLVILRLCNELLRRLSRAEDTSFCGRVFIFMFQSFPLGDRSSVNLRGEYHVENVTTYDESVAKKESGVDKMDVDSPESNGKKPADPKSSTKATASDAKKQSQATKSQPLDTDELYPIFWSLQATFSQPKKLFDAAHFAEFKQALESTMTTFSTVKPEQGSRQKQGDETKRGMKRKHNEGEDDLASAFNPKYLTSRDLFELEVNDLSFRRHVLVQALIIMSFLLSLTKEEKDKLGTLKNQNKSVLYSDYLLNEADTKWVSDMKEKISSYLKLGLEGPYFYRMVETVLSRDKHWVRWKVDNCPPISKDPVSAEEYHDSISSLQHKTINKRIKSMGSLPLDFLSSGDGTDAMEKFKAPDRYQLPELDTYKRKIADDDFEIEMPANAETKAAAIEGKASKSWQALRIASRFRLPAFDKIENEDNIDIIFEELAPEPEEAEETSTEPANLPDDHDAVAVVDPFHSRRSPLVRMLLERQPRAFKKVAAHTTRKPNEGEKNGVDFTFVDKQAFNMMRDGDQLLEFSEAETHSQGTSIKALDVVRESGKVPVLELDHSGLQQAKDMGLSGRFIFIEPPSKETIESELKEQGESEEQIRSIMKSSAEEAALSKAEGAYNTSIRSDDLEAAYKLLESFIYGQTTGEEAKNEEPKVQEPESQEEPKNEHVEGQEAKEEVNGNTSVGTKDTTDVAMADDDEHETIVVAI
ncbi:nuclear matrix protein [Thozetella sp. PMI_491]|nr:nuclear matrix protein [Thozetella sp. PMI_491]